MTCLSDDAVAARLDAVLQQLDEARLASGIDMSLDEAAARFEWSPNPATAFSHRVRQLAHFMRLLVRRGLRLSRRPTATDARDEAISILEQADGGFYDAVLARDDTPWNTQCHAAQVLLEALKQRERSKRITAVLAIELGGLDWDARRRAVGIIQQAWSQYMPPELADCAPEQLVDELPSLLLSISHVEQCLSQIAARH